MPLVGEIGESVKEDHLARTDINEETTLIIKEELYLLK